MAKQSGFLARQEAEKTVFMHDVEGIVRQYDIDTLHITLNEELGLGYDRIVRLTEKWMANQKKYHNSVGAGNIFASHTGQRFQCGLPIVPHSEQSTHSPPWRGIQWPYLSARCNSASARSASCSLINASPRIFSTVSSAC